MPLTGVTERVPWLFPVFLQRVNQAAVLPHGRVHVVSPERRRRPGVLVRLEPRDFVIAHAAVHTDAAVVDDFECHLPALIREPLPVLDFVRHRVHAGHYVVCHSSPSLTKPSRYALTTRENPGRVPGASLY